MESSSPKPVKDKRKRYQLSVDHSLRASLRQATAQKRLTVGLDRCINILTRKDEYYNESASFALQKPRGSYGLSPAARLTWNNQRLNYSNIQHILLKAFCAENRINTVQVAVDLSFLRFVCQLAGRSAEVAAGDKTDGADYNLILIEHHSGGPSREDLIWTAACQDGILCPHTGKNEEADVSITNAAKCQGSRARVTVGEIIV
ncbi:hypothetical protein C0Q70_16296 [Pomacea canaliculata]|uniref:Uncharacterized protein n=1 Tax=Pomacea canaliculata TaxID=400727 RepID=A0A2T7NPD5_POMCA|nr:hypothetical protein C0Q70_16296 [Pomacea canaliculata]